MESNYNSESKFKIKFTIPAHYMSLMKKSKFGISDMYQTKSILRQNQENLKNQIKSRINDNRYLFIISINAFAL